MQLYSNSLSMLIVTPVLIWLADNSRSHFLFPFLLTFAHGWLRSLSYNLFLSIMNCLSLGLSKLISIWHCSTSLSLLRCTLALLHSIPLLYFTLLQSRRLMIVSHISRISSPLTPVYSISFPALFCSPDNCDFNHGPYSYTLQLLIKIENSSTHSVAQ